jgi:hypothetical protein
MKPLLERCIIFVKDQTLPEIFSEEEIFIRASALCVFIEQEIDKSLEGVDLLF